MQEGSWHMKDIIAALDNCISTEERISEMITNTGTDKAATYARKARMITRENDNPTSSCLFCNGTNHRTATCDKFNSVTQRRRFFQQSGRCLNCGSQQHFVKECRSPGCKACLGQKHHHSLCPKRNEDEKSWSRRLQAQAQGTTESLRRSPQRKATLPPSKVTARTNLLSAKDPLREPQTERTNNEPATVLHNEESVNKNEESAVLLLTGIARIWNSIENKWMEVEILFDTGADQSFIGADLAKRIGADAAKMKSVQTYTFGTAVPKCVDYGVTQ
ncbi:unnamed protein product, partial [Strongylus vulgaris]